MKRFRAVIYHNGKSEYVDADFIWINPAQVKYVETLGSDPSVTTIHVGFPRFVRGDAETVAAVLSGDRAEM